MGTTSLGGEFGGLDWQLEHTSLARNWVRPQPTTSLLPPPWILLRLSPLRGELGPRKEGRGGSEPGEVDAGWQGPGGVVGPLPCPGHDIVLLGLLVDGATHAAVLQGTLPGQFPLLLCRETWEGSCVLPLGPLHLTARGSLGWACIVKPLASLGTVAGIPTPGPVAPWRQYLTLHNSRQIVRGNRKRLTPIFQELYSHVKQLVCA